MQRELLKLSIDKKKPFPFTIERPPGASEYRLVKDVPKRSQTPNMVRQSIHRAKLQVVSQLNAELTASDSKSDPIQSAIDAQKLSSESGTHAAQQQLEELRSRHLAYKSCSWQAEQITQFATARCARLQPQASKAKIKAMEKVFARTQASLVLDRAPKQVKQRRLG